jgi:CRISPR-associated exonuclease Cas4
MDDFLAISALQHFAYCPRQFALIHVEHAWAENLFTSEGRVLHERVDEGPTEQRHGVCYERAVSVISHHFRLTGKMDLLEVKTDESKGTLRYFPVEYKRGKPKLEDWDRIQLCAQALCIEEMRNTIVEQGAIWYWQVRHREAVDIDEALRLKTAVAIEGARAVLLSGQTPPPVNDRRCKACSLVDICGPVTFVEDRTGAYIEKMYVEGQAAMDAPSE